MPSRAVLPPALGEGRMKTCETMQNPTNPLKSACVLIPLGLMIVGAALFPTAAASCAVIDGRGGDPSWDVVIVYGGGGCTYDGHAAPYAEILGQSVLA